MAEAKQLGAPFELVRLRGGRRAGCPCRTSPRAASPPPPTPRCMMSLGAEAVFVGSGIFKSADPARRARAIVRATTHWQDAKIVAEVSRGLGEPMRGLDMAAVPAGERLRSAAGERGVREAAGAVPGQRRPVAARPGRDPRVPAHGVLVDRRARGGREARDRRVAVLRPVRARPAGRLRPRDHRPRDVRVPGRRVRAVLPPRPRPGPLAGRVRDGPSGPAGPAPLLARDARTRTSCTARSGSRRSRARTATWSASRPTCTRAQEAAS